MNLPEILWGDCLDVMRTMPESSIDAIVTDPPYGLEFMGKEWDSFGAPARGMTDRQRAKQRNSDAWYATTFGSYASGVPAKPRPGSMHAFQQWCEAWTTEALRVLKPGGHLLAFGGTRTWHRLACAVEDAGFEMRDSIAWLYGSGFPKSQNVSKMIDKAAGAERPILATIPDRWAGKGNVLQRSTQAEAESVDITAPATEAAQQWDGWGTALKPAFEPIVVARKPFRGTVAANVLTHGTGALNIDGCRIGTSESTSRPRGTFPHSDDSWGNGRPNEVSVSHDAGRWPANVILDPDQAAALDEQSGETTSGQRGSFQRQMTSKGYEGGGLGQRRAVDHEAVGLEKPGYGDSGGASRFFYVALPIDELDSRFRYCAKAPKKERPSYTKADGTVVAHPTVKPLSLMRYLCRLVTPPGGTVLDPFGGSGATAEAAMQEGLSSVVIEREADYLPMIFQRIARQVDNES